MAKRTAIIDIGSNSVRMVVFEKTSRFAFFLLHETKSRVRISEGAYENGGNLQEPAMQRALYALEEFLSIAHSYQARKMLCVATSALRDAPNAHLFKRRAASFGLKIKVIDGPREAYLGGVACANLLPPMRAMTIDVGGGSTECACLEAGSVVENRSLDLGTVRLKELFWDKADRKGAERFIRDALAAFPPGEQRTIIGVGGTFRALAQIMLRRNEHPINKLHGFTFEAGALLQLGDAILDAPDNDALAALGVKKERYDVIRPGTLIIMEMIRHTGCKQLVTSGVGVREGVFLSDLLRHNNDRFPHGFNPSLHYLMDRHNIETQFSTMLARTVLKLFDLLHAPLEIPSHYRRELAASAKLTKIGASVHFYDYHKNSFFLIESALEYGYTHEQIMLISALVRFHKRKRPSKSFIQVYGALLPDPRILARLNALLFIADALLAHRPDRLSMQFALDDDGTLVVTSASPLYLARERLDGMDKAIPVKIMHKDSK